MATDILICTLPPIGPVEVRIRPVAINLLLPGEQWSYSFDLAGRLIGGFVAGANYRRSFDGRVLRKRAGPGGREREWLDEAAAAAFLARAYELAERAARACGDARLDVLAGWTPERLAADAAWFRRIYRPVSILPPDQYLALVIQATEGCSYNSCAFCDFYRDRPFRIKGAEELRAHITEAQRFFGPAIGLRRSLFLADANALVAPMPRVRSWLDAIDEAGIRRPGDILPSRVFSFIDAFDVGRKSVEEWAELAARGLRRVYIGMESGDDALLRFLRKPGSARDVVEAVRTLKAGGVSVSVIIMTGVGGRQYAANHIDNTIAALAQMALAPGDIVYFSPFFAQPGSEYSRLAQAAGIEPLDARETAAQEAAIRRGLAQVALQGPGPQLARYDIREFVY
ncbi:MAG: radical SAM protein [Anaerolineae bacterium]|nr:radical SAM protein [Anaerolineae bacterium]